MTKIVKSVKKKYMTQQIKEYVLGFVYWRDNIALIYKTKGPEYVIGTWNAIGGKVEDRDCVVEEAMSREFLEETGIYIPQDDWLFFATQEGTVGFSEDKYILHCLTATLDSSKDYTNIENTEGQGEIVKWFKFDNFESKTDFYNLITPNLKWLIPLSRDKTTHFLDIREY